jgi:uncharacterized protein (UPF0371 family)
MGVNCAGFGIVDDEIVRKAATQEVISRYFRYSCEYVMGFVEKEAVQRTELLMKELDAKLEDRRVVPFARETAQEAQRLGQGNKGIYCGAAIELHDGSIVTGKHTPITLDVVLSQPEKTIEDIQEVTKYVSGYTTNVSGSQNRIYNVKKLAGIPDQIHLLSLGVIESIGRLKQDIMGAHAVSLNLDEILVALSISAATNPSAEAAMAKLKELNGCEAHMTHIPTSGDDKGLKRLGINITSDTDFSTVSLFDA